MTEEERTVVVVDDDPAMLRALGGLLRSVGLQAKLIPSLPEFVSAGRPNGPTCLVLDVRLPGRSGL
jgi:FixJ family two-component response regulator